MIKVRKWFIRPLILFIGLGWAASVSATELPQQTQAELDRASAQFLSEQSVRVNRVGYKILGAIPERGDGVKEAVLPFTYSSLNNKLKTIYQASKNTGVIVGDALPIYVKNTDLETGDEILMFQKMPVESINQFMAFVAQTKDLSYVTIRFKRQEKEWEEKIPVYYFPYVTKFAVTDQNAQAYLDWSDTEANTIVVSPTLIRMADSDDELAYVLAHQVAHLTSNHKKSSQLDAGSIIATQVVGQVMGRALGVNGVSIAAASSGFWVAGPYREQDEVIADYVALDYMRWAGFDPKAAVSFLEKEEIEIKPNAKESIREVHPSSVDRIALVKKRISEMSSSPANPESKEKPVLPQTQNQASSKMPDNAVGELGPDFSGGANPKIADLTNIGLAECQNYQFGIESDLKEDAVVFTNEPKRIAWHATSSDTNPFRGRYFEHFFIEWYRPDGQLEHKTEIKFLTGLQLVNSVAITDENAEISIGRWKVRLTQDDKIIDERYFLVRDVKAKILKKRSEILKNGGV